ncbi:hypothetical protein AVEN_70319-1 [Araneus ventricosus]|uniref:Uncharacterized protein n=1 Tax=Araneus ventricosus TaxID=182803 RepID=A0A4Y2W8K4_ARAVE|nr:hypothetical protein AVEN_70319-1 [Araneus ventricosus]
MLGKIHFELEGSDGSLGFILFLAPVCGGKKSASFLNVYLLEMDSSYDSLFLQRPPSTRQLGEQSSRGGQTVNGTECFTVKLDIHEETAPSHLERFAPDRSNFQPIHLGGSFTEAPARTTDHCDPRLQNGTPNPLRLPYNPLSHGLRFVAFAFVKEPRSPSWGSYFSFMTQRSKWNNRSWIFILFPELLRFSSNFCIDEGFWSGAKLSKWLGAVSL